jgi:hypothetical protein
LAACGGATATATPTAPPPPTRSATIPATAAPTETPGLERVRGTGVVQENAASSHVLTIRTSESVWYVSWNAIVLLDSPRGTLAPQDIPVGAQVTFDGVPDPLAKTPTLEQVTIHIQ